MSHFDMGSPWFGRQERVIFAVWLICLVLLAVL